MLNYFYQWNSSIQILFHLISRFCLNTKYLRKKINGRDLDECYETPCIYVADRAMITNKIVKFINSECCSTVFFYNSFMCVFFFLSYSTSTFIMFVTFQNVCHAMRYCEYLLMFNETLKQMPYTIYFNLKSIVDAVLISVLHKQIFYYKYYWIYV